MPKKILIGLGIVLALVIAIVVAVGFLSPDENSVTQSLSMTVGDRTITVSGKYKDIKQEALADGIKITADGHEITVSADQLEVDGKTQVLDPGQDVKILVDGKGAVSVKLARSDAGGPANAPQ